MMNNTDHLEFDASDLGLPPGRWPFYLILGDVRYAKGRAITDPDGDLLYVNYLTAKGELMRVYND